MDLFTVANSVPWWTEWVALGIALLVGAYFLYRLFRGVRAGTVIPKKPEVGGFDLDLMDMSPTRGEANQRPLSGRDVFISYSSKDARVVVPLVSLVGATGALPFLDKTALELGREWRGQIDQAIQDCRTMLVFWSENAAASKEVRREYLLAMKCGKPVIPVRITERPRLSDELSKFHGVRLFEVVGHEGLVGWEDQWASRLGRMLAISAGEVVFTDPKPLPEGSASFEPLSPDQLKAEIRARGR